MRAVVLAAGKGERLWPLTENKPKHLLPVGGKPILERTLEALAGQGVREIILVVHYRAEKIESKFGDGKQLGCDISYVRQRTPRGTADALKACHEEMEGEDRFVVLYGDDYYGREAVGTFLKTVHEDFDILMGAAQVEDQSRFGSLEVKDGLVTSIREKVSRKGPGQVNAGIYLMDASIFSAIEKTGRSSRGEFELTESIRLLIHQGKRVQALALGEGQWVGVSYPWDLLEANRLALDSQGVLSSGEVEAGANLKGHVSLGRSSVIKFGSYVEGPVFLGEGSEVGPDAYVRPYCTLGSNAKVGAGCEVKNSIVMDGAKIPHLSYVGDSVIGEGSSLGAGTITANLRFDDSPVRSRVKGHWVDSEKRKFGAVLGDNVRTGINVSLMPGVKIGSGAWIAPGTVVYHDVPARARPR